MSSLTNSIEEWGTAPSLVLDVRDTEEKKAVVSCKGSRRVEGQGIRARWLRKKNEKNKWKDLWGKNNIKGKDKGTKLHKKRVKILKISPFWIKNTTNCEGGLPTSPPSFPGPPQQSGPGGGGGGWISKVGGGGVGWVIYMHNIYFCISMEIQILVVHDNCCNTDFSVTECLFILSPIDMIHGTPSPPPLLIFCLENTLKLDLRARGGGLGASSLSFRFFAWRCRRLQGEIYTYL